MRFIGDLTLKDIDGSIWVVASELTWESCDGRTLVIPAGFVTDLATIPAPLNKILRTSGAWDKATVLHDYLYSNRTPAISRLEADNYLLEALDDCGVGKWTALLMYTAVRLFGSGRWTPS